MELPIVQIIPKVQHYDWGDESFIPSLLGRTGDGRPWAELWFGTHPGAESTLPEGIPLGDHLREHALEYLGPDVMVRYGKDLPFLLKVLSIARPFSLQVHPSSVQAQRGYAQEASGHAGTERGTWNYKDDRQKAEILYALTPVTALSGFLKPAEIKKHLTQYAPVACTELFPLLGSAESEETQLEHLFTRLCTLDDSARGSLLAEVQAHLGNTEASVMNSLLGQLLSEFPDDPAALAPLFLNTIRLEPGEALYIEPRILHTFVKGHGIELMSNSDNVLRAGLTRKKMDIPEVLGMISYRVQEPVRCPHVSDELGRTTILAPAEEFLLSLFRRGSTSVNARNSVEMLLCTEGSAHLRCKHADLQVAKGQCVLIGASVEGYHVETGGTLFSITVPAGKR
jgi:mannose-6-phosphate isomerase